MSLREQLAKVVTKLQVTAYVVGCVYSFPGIFFAFMWPCHYFVSNFFFQNTHSDDVCNQKKKENWNWKKETATSKRKMKA